MLGRFVIPFSVASALALSAETVTAADCSPPGWLKTIEIKATSQEAVGIGKGSTLALARREARRAIAQKVALPRAADILALPQVKGEVNRKVYSAGDLAKAVARGAALGVKPAKTLAEETVCKTVYVALAANTKAFLLRLRENQELGQAINAALSGKIEQLEEANDDKEAEPPVVSYALPERTGKRLSAAAEGVGTEGLLNGVMHRFLKKRAMHLKEGIDQKAKLEPLEDEARDAEKLIAAARELKQKNYIALFEMLSARASEGEEETQFLVGYMYGEALGVKRDDAEALQWLKRSASKNFGPAKALIGVMAYSGRGSKADQKEAAQWLESARGDGWACELTLNQCSR